MVGTQKLTLAESQPLRALAPNFLVLHYHLAIWQSAPSVTFIVDGMNWGNDYPTVTMNESWFWHNQAGTRVAAIDDGKLLMNVGDSGLRRLLEVVDPRAGRGRRLRRRVRRLGGARSVAVGGAESGRAAPRRDGRARHGHRRARRRDVHPGLAGLHDRASTPRWPDRACRSSRTPARSPPAGTPPTTASPPASSSRGSPIPSFAPTDWQRSMNQILALVGQAQDRHRAELPRRLDRPGDAALLPGQLSADARRPQLPRLLRRRSARVVPGVGRSISARR